MNVFDDSVAEGPEELFVDLSAAAGPTDKGVAFHRNAAQLTIVDDDSKTIIIFLIVQSHVLLSTAVPPGFQGQAPDLCGSAFFALFVSVPEQTVYSNFSHVITAKPDLF